VSESNTNPHYILLTLQEQEHSGFPEQLAIGPRAFDDLVIMFKQRDDLKRELKDNSPPMDLEEKRELAHDARRMIIRSELLLYGVVEVMISEIESL
jgi:hypothetical protein